MFFWFVALAVAGVFLVFRDPAIDYRAVALGALLPDLVDGLSRRGVGPFHSVVTSVALLVVVMLVTIGRRSVRRRLLAGVVGVFAHLVLDGAWANTDVFWWPISGSITPGRLPWIDRGIAIVVVQEIVGVGVAVWLYRRFALATSENRAELLRSGRLGI